MNSVDPNTIDQISTIILAIKEEEIPNHSTIYKVQELINQVLYQPKSDEFREAVLLQFSLLKELENKGWLSKEDRLLKAREKVNFIREKVLSQGQIDDDFDDYLNSVFNDGI